MLFRSQCSCLENPMDRGAYWATVHGIAKSRTQLSDFTFTLVSFQRVTQLVCTLLHKSDTLCRGRHASVTDIHTETSVSLQSLFPLQSQELSECVQLKGTGGEKQVPLRKPLPLTAQAKTSFYNIREPHLAIFKGRSPSVPK